MTHSISISAKLLAYYLFVFLGAIFLFFSGVNTIYIITLVIWLFFMAYATHDLVKNMPLLCFLASFFVFLLGRELVYSFFGVKRYYIYLEDYNNISFTLIGASLIFVMLGYTLTNHIKFKDSASGLNYSINQENSNIENVQVFRRVCRFVFVICYLAAVVEKIYLIIFVRRSGYLASYLEGGISGKLSILSYFSSFLGVSISLLLATAPEKNEAMKILVLYEIYGMLTLLTGHRYIFIATSMYISIYCCIRQKNEGNWVARKHIVTAVVLLPIIIILMTAIDSIRIGNKFEFTSIYNSLINFLNQQGGSDNVIKRIFYYKDDLRDMRFTSLSNIRNVLFENIIARKVFHVQSYTGNSVAHALRGNSLAHRLSYYEYGKWYLEGRGVGSCYIAELFCDFGWPGVIVGNVIYGKLLRKINSITFNKPLSDGILLAIIYYIILAPRAEFDAAIGNVFSLYSVLGIATILLIYKSILARMY